jgi:acetyltransferase-like isoleucine patch superfamily enzyme
MCVDEWILAVKNRNTPVFRMLRATAKFVIQPRGPRVPRFLKPLLRLAYEGHFGMIALGRLLITALYRHPLFQARCASVGRNVSIDGLPYVEGHTRIEIGNDVWLGGKICIASGGQVAEPRLIIKDHAKIGWNVNIVVSKEVVIEEHVKISFDCRISDTDGHPREAGLRAQNRPPRLEDIRPVRICRYAWIGNGSHIMKGVTIGEGAVIGANSVVISDIPPYCLAMGNPAEVYFRNFGRASKTKAQSAGNQPRAIPEPPAVHQLYSDIETNPVRFRHTAGGYQALPAGAPVALGSR